MMLEQRPEGNEGVSLASVRGGDKHQGWGAGGLVGQWRQKQEQRWPGQVVLAFDLGGSEPLAFSR